jgi:hypothetical protein
MFILVRNRRPTQWFILVSAFVMFTLSTADIALSFRLMTHDIAVLEPSDLDSVYLILKRLYEKNLIFVSNKSALHLMSTVSIS